MSAPTRSNRLAIRSASHYYATIEGDSELPSIAARLLAVTGEKIRRIDRFIELALLGAGECAGNRELMPDCALYLASGIGPVGNNIVVQEAVVRDRKLPMPFAFVNTLGSSAGFYVARRFNLSGQSLFVSRRGGSFAAALESAIVDFASGAAAQALIGAVEECTLPLNQHRERQQLLADTVVGEGTHWLLVEPSDFNGPTEVIADIETPDIAFHDSRDAALLTNYLTRNWNDRYLLEVDDGGRAVLQRHG